MKKLLVKILTLAFVFGASQSFGQSIDDILNKAQGALSNSSNKQQWVEVLSSAGKAVQNELNGADAEFKSKLMNQAESLIGLVPSALSGKTDLNVFSSIINKVKLLIAANRLKSALKDGRSGVTGNNTKILSALNLMKGATSGIGSDQQKGLEKLVSSAINSTEKANKGGLFKNCKAKKAEKQLNQIVSLVTTVL